MFCKNKKTQLFNLYQWWHIYAFHFLKTQWNLHLTSFCFCNGLNKNPLSQVAFGPVPLTGVHSKRNKTDLKPTFPKQRSEAERIKSSYLSCSWRRREIVGYASSVRWHLPSLAPTSFLHLASVFQSPRALHLIPLRVLWLCAGMINKR